MQNSTLKILEATLKSDASITAAKRNHLLKIARESEFAVPVALPVQKAMRRSSRCLDQKTRCPDNLIKLPIIKI